MLSWLQSVSEREHLSNLPPTWNESNPTISKAPFVRWLCEGSAKLFWTLHLWDLFLEIQDLLYVTSTDATKMINTNKVVDFCSNDIIC